MAFWKGQGQRPRNLAQGVRDRTVDLTPVPPRSPRVILTDRADETLWLLSFNTAEPSVDGLGYISIVAPVPERPDRGNFRVFGPYDGPLLVAEPSPTRFRVLRLLVRSGYLGYEETDLTTRQGRVMARRKMEALVREIVVPASWRAEPDMLAWRDVEF